MDWAPGFEKPRSPLPLLEIGARLFLEAASQTLGATVRLLSVVLLQDGVGEEGNSWWEPVLETRRLDRALCSSQHCIGGFHLKISN